MEDIEVTDTEVAFGTMKGLPAREDIPEEFRPACKCSWPGKPIPEDGPERWLEFFSDCFFKGIADLQLYPKEGVDVDKAWRHIRALMRSWMPSHGDKESGCAYLMSQYFERVEWKAYERNEN